MTSPPKKKTLPQKAGRLLEGPTGRVEGDPLVGGGRPAASRGAGEDQLLVVEEGGGAGGRGQQETRGAQLGLALRKKVARIQRRHRQG